MQFKDDDDYYDGMCYARAPLCSNRHTWPFRCGYYDNLIQIHKCLYFPVLMCTKLLLRQISKSLAKEMTKNIYGGSANVLELDTGWNNGEKRS